MVTSLYIGINISGAGGESAALGIDGVLCCSEEKVQRSLLL